jgi:hypothetical protein
MNIVLKKEDWKPFLENLSRRRYEWMTEVEIVSSEIGDQTLSSGLPLNGITLESAGAGTAVVISVGETVGNHQTHTVRNPTRVAYLGGDTMYNDVVDIEEADGTKTLLRFTEPMSVVAGLGEYAEAAATC